MKHLYVLMSWPDNMDMLWIKFLVLFLFLCSANLSCFMIAHIFKDKHKMGGHKFSEFACNLLSTQSVFLVFLLSPSSTDTSRVGWHQNSTTLRICQYQTTKY